MLKSGEFGFKAGEVLKWSNSAGRRSPTDSTSTSKEFGISIVCPTFKNRSYRSPGDLASTSTPKSRRPLDQPSAGRSSIDTISARARIGNSSNKTEHNRRAGQELRHTAAKGATVLRLAARRANILFCRVGDPSTGASGPKPPTGVLCLRRWQPCRLCVPRTC